VNKKLFLLFVLILGVFSLSSAYLSHLNTGAPPYGEPENEVPTADEYSWMDNWRRPDGPPRVGLQVGHWQNYAVPEELSRLRGNTGSSGGGKAEWEVNHAIASLTSELLKKQGIEVDILPATVPPDYWADAFIAIHADGNLDSSKRGYKFATSWRDFTGKANLLLEHLDKTYGLQTNLPKDPVISRNMRGYYAFAWWRYEHTIHPMTPGVIAETGFLTSPQDRKIIVSLPEISAQALADGILSFLRSQKIIN
jgi:N-acetylmuramoyl-L-alanine amidase